MNTYEITILELRKAIKNLYIVFSKYELRENINYCPCGCISSEDINNIYSKPLQELTDNELGKYSFKAMSTWGDSYDFRHFFPRLTELMLEGGYPLAYSEIILSKLDYGEWQTWDTEEQEAILSYFIALWRFILSKPLEKDASYTKSDEFLCAISQSLKDPSFLLGIVRITNPNRVK